VLKPPHGSHAAFEVLVIAFEGVIQVLRAPMLGEGHHAA
jgi:hypothetical protein